MLLPARLLAGALALGAALGARAHEAHDAPAAPRTAAPSASARPAASPAARAHVHAAAPVVSAAFDLQGRLWRAAVRGGRVLVSSSTDLGATFGPEVAVNPEPQTLWAEGENRPKLGFDARGRVHVTYTEKVAADDPMAGHIRWSRSADGGKTFSAPQIVNGDRQPISHRFDTLLVAPGGAVWIAWQDLRGAAAARRAGLRRPEGALYVVHAPDGEQAEPERRVVDGTCECCKPAGALGSDGVPVLFWRHVYPGSVRDHALVRLVPGARPVRAAEDGWQVPGCPHQGPALAAGEGGALHLAWFTGAPGKQGIAYARSGDGGRSVGVPVRFLAGAQTHARPAVLAAGARVWLAWKAFDGTTTRVMVARSDDGGAHWREPVVAASATQVNDHPQLLQHGGRAYLAWSVEGRTWRLQALAQDKP